MRGRPAGASREGRKRPGERPLVGILMGSDSDWEEMEPAAEILRDLGVAFEIEVTSAHRSPRRTAEYAAGAAGRGLQVLIAGAGAAAHLAGAVAAHTLLPVIGVPIPSSPLAGIDSLLAMAQMPGGVPVATMALGKTGARNAGLLAAEILALRDEGLRRKLASHRERMASDLGARSERLKEKVRREGA